MPQPYRFGRFYAGLSLVAAACSAWLAGTMLWYGFALPAALAAAGTLLSAAVGIGLWQRRRYGWILLNISIACGIAANFYAWFAAAQISRLLHGAESLASFAFMAILFVYFYKRRMEFS